MSLRSSHEGNELEEAEGEDDEQFTGPTSRKNCVGVDCTQSSSQPNGLYTDFPGQKTYDRLNPGSRPCFDQAMVHVMFIHYPTMV